MKSDLSTGHMMAETRPRVERPEAHSRLKTPTARLWALVAFLVVLAFTGGGSRSDISSLLLLRPLSICFAAYAFLTARRDDLSRVLAPLVIVLSVMALALLQLTPLPWSWWKALPHRGDIAELSRLFGMEGIWRPISLDPNRTWNTFFSLFVPLAAIGLYSIQTPENRRYALIGLIGVGLASVAMGQLQMMSGDALHLYRITNSDYPVGLFANRNHQAVFLAWCIPAMVFVAVNEPFRFAATTAFRIILPVVIMMLFVLIVLTGSRAGLVLSLPAIAMASAFYVLSGALERRQAMGARWARHFPVIAAVGIALLSALVIATLAVSGRALGIERIFGNSALEDERWSFLPHIWKMVWEFMPFGAGLGAFEQVFEMFEPDSLLSVRYLNQAHNDLLQFMIAGGVFGVAIIVASLCWAAFALVGLFRRGGRLGIQLVLFYGGSLAIWLAASLLDYPLRTPIGAATLAVLTAALCSLNSRRNSGRNADLSDG